MMEETQTGFSTLNINESWVELGSVMANTVRITENFASSTEKQYLADLEQELKKSDPINDGQKEKKIADTLAKLVTLADVAEDANKCLAIFVRAKLHTIELLGSLSDQLYDQFAMAAPEDRKLAMAGLKTLITEIHLDGCVSLTREVKLAYCLVDSLIPRIIGGLSKANMEDSMEMMGLILRRFALITRTHRNFKNVHLWAEYFCTGVVLGKGAFATVFLGRHVKTAKAVAIKTMDWDNLTLGKPRQEAALTNEIEIMRASNHPNIVRLHDVIRDGCMIHLVMEFCGGGTLEDYIQSRGPLPEPEARHFVRQLALGLKFLRDKGIIHRDLKPENLLLSTDQETATLKIADFTFARFIEPGDLATTLVGSPLYMAPEIFFEHRYSEKADLWSVGAIVYKMLTQQPPYPSKSVPELIHNLQTQTPRMPEDATADMKDLLRSLLERNPDLRISWTEFFLHKCLNLNTLGQSSVGNQLSDSEQVMVKDHELSELRKELEGLKAANSRLQQETSTMEKQLREAALREKKQEEEKAVLMAEMAKLKDGNDSTKKKDGDNWLKLIAREQQISAQLETDCRRWQETAEASEAELALLRKQVAEHSAREDEWRASEAVAKAEKQMVYAEIAELRSGIETIVEAKNRSRDEAEEAKKQLVQANRALEAHERGNDVLVNERLRKQKAEGDALHAAIELQLREEIVKLMQKNADVVAEMAVYKLLIDEEQKERTRTYFRS